MEIIFAAGAIMILAFLADGFASQPPSARLIDGMSKCGRAARVRGPVSPWLTRDYEETA